MACGQPGLKMMTWHEGWMNLDHGRSHLYQTTAFLRLSAFYILILLSSTPPFLCITLFLFLVMCLYFSILYFLSMILGYFLPGWHLLLSAYSTYLEHTFHFHDICLLLYFSSCWCDIPVAGILRTDGAVTCAVTCRIISL